MVSPENIKKLLASLTDNLQYNLIKIKEVFTSLDYRDDEDQTLLHIFVDNIYDEEKCLKAIKTLLASGMNPNSTAYYQYNFIQTALYAGYSEKFILKIIEEALKYGLNVNHEDCDFDSMMHTAIYSDDYNGGLENIFILLADHGFNIDKRDGEKRDLVEAMIYQKTYNDKQIQSFKSLILLKKNKAYKCDNLIRNDNNQMSHQKEEQPNQSTDIKQPVNNQTLSAKVLEELEKYGKILNRKNYLSSPSIGREKELKNLIITLASEKIHPIIIGESGVGKTNLVEELVYQIVNNNVPNFLQGKIVLEINPSELVAGCEYTGQFEEKVTKIFQLCEKHDVILFIDEIHTIYGIGATKNKDTDLAAILKHYIDRTNLKVIGTTTKKEYDTYFENDTLKRRFEKITIEEPTNEMLYEILNKIIDDYFLKFGLVFENEKEKDNVISTLIKMTARKHRVYNDVVNNPDLSISIIDKAYAIARVYDSKFITSKHFAESIEYCNRIYETTKTDAIKSLRNPSIFNSLKRTRIIRFTQYNKHKK